MLERVDLKQLQLILTRRCVVLCGRCHGDLFLSWHRALDEAVGFGHIFRCMVKAKKVCGGGSGDGVGVCGWEGG